MKPSFLFLNRTKLLIAATAAASVLAACGGSMNNSFNASDETPAGQLPPAPPVGTVRVHFQSADTTHKITDWGIWSWNGPLPSLNQKNYPDDRLHFSNAETYGAYVDVSVDLKAATMDFVVINSDGDKSKICTDPNNIDATTGLPKGKDMHLAVHFDSHKFQEVWLKDKDCTIYNTDPDTAGADTQAPTQPADLALASAAASSSVKLTWTASTDNVAVAGYNVMRDGTKIGTADSNSYTDSTVAAGQTYSYTVTAVDAAGNVSPASTALSVTTPNAAPPSATVAPSTMRLHFKTSNNNAGQWGVWSWEGPSPALNQSKWPDDRVLFNQTDSYGVYVDVPVDATVGDMKFLVIDNAGNKNCANDEVVTFNADIATKGQEIWMTDAASGDPCAILSAPPVAPSTMRLHFKTSDNNAGQWGVWSWEGPSPALNQSKWPDDRVLFNKTDSYGVYVDVPVDATVGDMKFLVIDNAGNKNCANDEVVTFNADIATKGQEIWMTDATSGTDPCAISNTAP